MKVYVTARYKGSENQKDIEELCMAVRLSGMQDYCFIRDEEKYQDVFGDPKALWQRALERIKECDAMLIDVSDEPSGGRVVEAGIAYALGQPLFVIVKRGIKYKELYDGIANSVIEYDKMSDITPHLANFIGMKA